MQTAVAPQNRRSFFMALPAPLLYGVIVLIIVAALVGSTLLAWSQAAAEAAAAGAESSFELEDMYRTWSWIVVIGSMVLMIVYGLKQGWPFASSVQIALIVTLTVCFALIAQTVDRDFYSVGIFALIIFTLVQIAFGNIAPTANLRQSLVGLAITAIILSVVVALSIWLVPSLIQLGR